MSGVWVFNKGVVHLVENPGGNPDGSSSGSGGRSDKVLVHLPSGEVITSYELLGRKLAEQRWERYPGTNPRLLQFHKQSSVHLISVPRDFTKFKTVHMYDIVVKNRNIFEVRDA